MKSRHCLVISICLVLGWPLSPAYAEEVRDLKEFFEGREPGVCDGLDIRLPAGVVIRAREQDNDFFVLHGCDFHIQADAIELVGDVAIKAFDSPSAGKPATPAKPNTPSTDGAAGVAGKVGATGKKGSNANTVTILVDRLDGDGTLAVRNHGQDAGPGGDGGKGGDGAKGKKGRKAKNGVVDCKRGGGNGKRGGNAGLGGNGGNGGVGGNGGTIEFSSAIERAALAGKVSLSVGKGDGGPSGQPGGCGSPGSGGGGGNGDGFCKGGKPGPKGAACSGTAKAGIAGKAGQCGVLLCRGDGCESRSREEENGQCPELGFIAG